MCVCVFLYLINKKFELITSVLKPNIMTLVFCSVASNGSRTSRAILTTSRRHPNPWQPRRDHWWNLPLTLTPTWCPFLSSLWTWASHWSLVRYLGNPVDIDGCLFLICCVVVLHCTCQCVLYQVFLVCSVQVDGRTLQFVL